MKRRPILTGFIVALVALTLVYLVVKAASRPVHISSSKSVGIFAGKAVGVVQIEGPIYSGKQWLEDLKRFEDSSEVKAVVLRINSGGGAVGTAQELYREINRLKESKPVVASIENIGASAAYYIASAADKIVLSPGTFTGSIGVIYINLNMGDLYEWMRIDPEVLKAGKFKDIGSTFRSMTDDERRLLQGLLDQVHRQFIEDVSKGRGLEFEEVKKVADGRVITGEQAIELGFADEIGNFNDAVNIAAELAGMEGEPRLIYPKRKFEWQMFFESFSDAIINKMLETGSVPLYRYNIDRGELDE